ncbi:hypothetical protein JCM1393_13360 [Clostridium carnis]
MIFSTKSKSKKLFLNSSSVSKTAIYLRNWITMSFFSRKLQVSIS